MGGGTWDPLWDSPPLYWAENGSNDGTCDGMVSTSFDGVPSNDRWTVTADVAVAVDLAELKDRRNEAIAGVVGLSRLRIHHAPRTRDRMSAR